MKFFGPLSIFTTAILPLTAAIPIDSISPTSTGAALAFRTPVAGSCAVKIYDLSGAVVDDTNESLFPGSTNCNRPGSSMSGSQVVFNAGGGGTVTALDGRPHSRNLLAGNTYRYELHSGSEYAIGVFVTSTAAVTSSTAMLSSLATLWSYANGSANFCSSMSGFPVPALCTAPSEIPIGSFPAPALGRYYFDPNFGSTVTSISPAGTYKHSYSTPSPLSTTGRYTQISDNTYTAIVETATGRTVMQRARAYRTWSTGDFIWDPTDDDVFYYFSTYWTGTAIASDKIMRYRISTNSETVIQDYSKTPFSYTNVFRGGTGEMSKDGWLPFMTNTQAVCVLQVLPGRAFYGQTFCADYGSAGGLGWTVVDFTSISKGPDRATGMHYIIVQGSPANAVFQFDSTRGVITFQFRGPDVPTALAGRSNGNGICETGETCLSQAHSDTMEDASGTQYLVRAVQLASPCSLVLSALRLSAGTNMLTPASQGGGRTDIATLALCGSIKWPSIHVGCSRRASFCAVSLENVPLSTTVVRDGAPYNGEIWVIRGTGQEIRRVAMHRSVIRGYVDQPKVGIDDFGAKVVWDTNFGTTLTRVVAADTGLR